MKNSEWSVSNFLAGSVAGALSATLINPIEVLRAQRQRRGVLGKSTLNVSQIIQRVYSRNGWRGFYNGLPLTLMGIIPARGSYFWVYHKTKTTLKEIGYEGAKVHLAAGALSSILSNTLTNPIWLLKTRFMIQAADNIDSRSYSSIPDAIKKIWQEEGINGFYKGLRASYWGSTETAIHFMLYEKIREKAWDTETYGPEPVWLPGAAGGGAKLCAATITYPHELVRTRMREKPIKVNEPPKYTGMIQGLRLIAYEEGWLALYKGLGLHLARTVPNNIFLFLFFEKIKAEIEKHTS